MALKYASLQAAALGSAWNLDGPRRLSELRWLCLDEPTEAPSDEHGDADAEPSARASELRVFGF